jgi:hypothetical protein
LELRANFSGVAVNATKFFFTFSLGFIFAYSLIPSAILLTDFDVHVEQRFSRVAGTVAGFHDVELRCSTISPLGMSFREEARIFVEGYGYAGNTGYVGRGVVTVYEPHNQQRLAQLSGYISQAHGYLSYRGYQGSDDIEIAENVVSACLQKNILINPDVP